MAYTIKLDKIRTLHFTTRALYELEDQLGEPVAGFMTTPAKMASVRILCAIVWAGQLHEEDHLDLEGVIDNFNLKTFSETMETCGDALIVSMGGDPEEEEKPSKKRKKK